MERIPGSFVVPAGFDFGKPFNLLILYLFINTELTVHLFRLPVGEWLCLDAVSRIDPGGIGVAESVLWDEQGRIGRGNQSLLVAPRNR